MTEVERFWSKVRKSDGCWEWTASINPNGYGQFFKGSKCKITTRAHRYSYELVNGPIPEDRLVRHTCDNRRCVRPDHLILGSRRDNNMDAVLRDRNTQLCEREKLSAIMLAEGSTNEVAARFGVSSKFAWRAMQARLLAERAGWTPPALAEEKKDV